MKSKNKSRHKNCISCSFKSILWAGIFLGFTLAEAEQLDNHTALSATSKSTIAEDALSSLSGISAINISAGDGNLQQNSAAIAVSSNGGFSASQITPSQKNQFNSTALSTATSQVLKGEILSGAFADGVGIVMVNQSTGRGNSQLNGAAIAVGGPGSFAAIELGDMELASQRSVVDMDSQNQLAGGQEEGTMEAILADDAFRNAQGIVQINQVVGNGNRTVNALSMSLQIQSQ
jgi:hypothetical protein